MSDEEIIDSTDDLNEMADSATPDQEQDADVPKEDAEDEDEAYVPKFDKKKKKKKKRKEVVAEPVDDPDDDLADHDAIDDGDDNNGEYTYSYLLSRAFDMIHDNNPELAGVRRSRVSVTVPIVARRTRKTLWTNFQQSCKNFNRHPNHVRDFFLAELGTTGNLDGDGALVINGRFNAKHLESLQMKYINHYILCRNCKATNTELKKENRMYFVVCRTCGSTRSVQAVSKGFVANVQKRRLRKA